jgi:hypothetical protein
MTGNAHGRPSSESGIMPSSDHKARVYEELADWEHQHGSPQARDRFLILAADAALAAGHAEDAERFRARLLELNPHHLLRPYASMADAMKSSDVHSYVADLRGTYPPEEAEKLLNYHQGDRPGGTAPPVQQHPLPELPPPAEVLRGLPHAGETGPIPLAPETAEETAPFGTMRVPVGTAPAPRKSVRPEPEPEEPDAEESPAGIGVFVSDALFVLLLGAGLALAGYTLLRPFLPSLPEAPFK